MARRSLGVVLIVALVSGTVNWLTFGLSLLGVKASTLGRQLWCRQELHLPTDLNLPLRATPAALRYCDSLLLAIPDGCSFHHPSQNARPPRLITGVRPRLAARPPTATLRTARAAVIRTLSSLWPTAAKAKTPNSAPKMAKTAAPDPTANPAATRTSRQPAPRTPAPTPAVPPRIIPAATANPTPDP